MIFVFIMLVIMTLLLFSFTWANKQKYGTYRWPLAFAVACLGATIYVGTQMPKAIDDITKKKQDQSAAASSSTDLHPTQRTTIATTNNLQGLSAEQANQEIASQERNMTANLDKMYNKIGDVTFDSKTKTFQLMVFPDSDTDKAIQELQQHHEFAKESHWDDFTKNLVTTSQNLNEKFKPGYSMSLIDTKTQQPLFTAKDGKTTYDFATK